MENHKMKPKEKKSAQYSELYNEKGKTASMDEVVNWFLAHFEGMEHWAEGGNTKPETWYTITTILRRCLTRIQERDKYEI